jgi:hypothetical protein
MGPADNDRCWWRRHIRRRAAAHVVRITIRSLTTTTTRSGHMTVTAHQDRALVNLLTRAVTSVRQLDGLSDVPDHARPASDCRVSVPVHTELRAPDGGESMYTHATALVAQWPSWLRVPDSSSNPVAAVSPR